MSLSQPACGTYTTVCCMLPQVNWALMIGCVAVVAGFQDTTALGHAYGVAVISVMLITTVMMALVMLVVWGLAPWLVLPFLGFFAAIEGLFLSANLIKVPEGGWVALMIAALVASMKLIWW